MAYSILLTLVSLVAVYGLVAKDEILSLPGWTGALPTRQFSGYLSLGTKYTGTNLHYWLVQSEVNPETAPTLIWFNGGPGCSSLDGYIYEHGPFQISSDLKLTPRPYSWNKLANVLYIEAPVGVGFSYSDTLNYKCTDSRTATENRAAVEKFFELYPELLKNKLYLTGESYAGMYVPTLAQAILSGEADGTYTGAKLSGIAVGNGVTGISGTISTWYEWAFLSQTALIDNGLKVKIAQTCDWESAKANKAGAISAACSSLLNQASQEIQNVNTYGIYTDCVDAEGCAAASPKRGKVPPANYVSMVRGPEACIDSRVASAWLNLPEVQAAIHVKKPANCWWVCGTAPGWSYSSNIANLPTTVYPSLYSNISVVIYSGDWDACVPYTNSEGWTTDLGLPVKNSWHSWSYTSPEGNDNQVAGYATGYNVAGGNFQFITVKGGRHEVPITAPGQALEMIRRLINDIAF